MKKGKREDRWQKAIIGIAMAVFMLAAVMAAMVPIGGAESRGDNFNHIVKDTVPQKVLIGQNLQFEGFDAPPIVYRLVSGDIENTYQADANNRIYNVNWPTSGAYYVNYNSTTKKREAQLSVEEPDMPLELKVGTKKVSSLAVGTNLIIDTGGMNLFPEDQVDLVVIGPDGQIKHDEVNNQQFTDIKVSYLEDNYGSAENTLETSGWTIGDYTFKVKTDDTNACGLEAESAVKGLKIIKGTITIEAETTSTVELETLKLTVTGVADDPITVEASPLSKNVLFKEGIGDTPTGANFHGNWFTGTIDADGIRKYAVEFNDTGTYTIKVTVTGGDREGDSDTVDITVLEKEVTFDLPDEVVIGDKIKIKGTSTSGTYVSVYVDDTLYKKLVDIVIEDGEFDQEVKTTDVGMDVPGSVRLKAWIDCDKAEGEERPTRSPDGEDAILLSKPTLTAELSVPLVALGDDFKVKGISGGVDTVNILAVGPKGSGGTAIDTGKISTNYAENLFGKTVSVSTLDRTFETKIDVDEDSDTGLYIIAVLSPGRDGIYDGLPGEVTPNIFAAVFVATYNLVSFAKTQDQIVSMTKDATIDAAGSDDLAWGGYIMVQPPSLLLNTVSDVPLGEPLVVTGTTNRKEGYIVLVETKGPVTLAPQTVPVTNGTFCATFDTATAEEGTYTVTADDGDGHTDEATVEILETAPTSTPLSATPTSKVSPTPPPAVSPKPTATPKPPGFDVVFAIAGLLAVAYFVLIRKK